MVGDVASTSLMRSAHTAARGIMIVMKLAMTMPMRICIRYDMKAIRVPTSTSPSPTRWRRTR